ncbi:MAG: 30S ribosomal protein S18 [Brevibacterium sp.]
MAKPEIRKPIKKNARRVTGVTVQEQRVIAKAVKNAREMALLPYSSSAR